MLFTVKMATTGSSLHNKFEQNFFKIRYETSKIGLIILYSLIALKFDTHKKGIKEHLGTKFGSNTINSQGVISKYS